MAEILKRTFELLALRVRLMLGETGQRVELRLEYHGWRGDPELWSDELAGPSLNLFAKEFDPNLLSRIAEDCRRAVAGANVSEALPIWLHLSKPYGWLGCLAWEQALEKALERPVLRLPDFLEKARENPDTLDVAVCSDLPDVRENADQIVLLVRQILMGSPRERTQVHVFATAGNASTVRKVFRLEPRVWVAPQSALPYSETSLWLRRMAQALRERSVDVVHFVCRGAVSGERPYLRLTEPSAHGSPAPVRLVSISEITAALTSLGAWAAALTPPRNTSDVELRWFADALAQARPGAVLFDDGKAVAESYRFMFSPEPSIAPRLASGFMYCQPSMVAGMLTTQLSIGALAQNAHLFMEAAADLGLGRAKRLAEVASLGLETVFPTLSGLVGLHPTAPESKGATPTWIAAAQRYVEATSLDLLRKRSADVLMADRVQNLVEGRNEPAHQRSGVAPSPVVDRTLSELQAVVARFAAKAGD